MDLKIINARFKEFKVLVSGVHTHQIVIDACVEGDKYILKKYPSRKFVSNLSYNYTESQLKSRVAKRLNLK